LPSLAPTIRNMTAASAPIRTASFGVIITR
jgi:hypothetical protein